MIYHWKVKPGDWPRCYITACVALPDQLAAGNKSYTAEGDITAIEIWKVSTPQDSASLKTLSWNTRPERLSLLGTVNFTSHYAQSQVPALHGQELRWPTPLFDCSSMVDMAVEIACATCRLQFSQISSSPPLGQYLVFRLTRTWGN
jgi:N-acetylglucosamine kinase-like BadF-type ATPase